MADKYIIHGAQYDGDGTSSAEASADGGVGAWNDITVGVSGTPTHGTAQAPGDTVHIKSCDAAGADIDLILTAQVLFQPGDTVNGSVRYIVDDGTIWAQTGTIKIKVNVDDNCFEVNSVSNGFFYLDGADRLTLQSGQVSTTNSNCTMNFNGYTIVKNVIYIFSDDNDDTGIRKKTIIASSYNQLRFYNCVFKKVVANGSYNPYVWQPSYGQIAHFINCRFETSTSDSSDSLFYFSSFAAPVYIDGGSWPVKHADSIAVYSSVNSGAQATATNFDAPPDAMRLPFKTTLDSNSDSSDNAMILSSTMRNRGFGWSKATQYGFAMYDGLGNYPYLNATTPAGQGWAVRAMASYASADIPFDFVRSQILYDLASEAKTITLHLAVRDNYSTPQKSAWYLKIEYIDSGDTTRIETSQGTGDLDADTLTWSAENGSNQPYYGAQVFDKYKIAITTAHAIKQNTEILVTLMIETPAPDTASFFLVDPYPEIS